MELAIDHPEVPAPAAVEPPLALTQHRAVAELARSEERYALAIRAANDGIWDWDLISDTIWFSPRWHAILGRPHPAGDQPPAAWLDLVHPADADRLRAAIHRHLEGHSPPAAACCGRPATPVSPAPCCSSTSTGSSWSTTASATPWGTSSWWRWRRAYAHRCGPKSTVARLGGDEFAVTLEDINGLGGGRRTGGRARLAFAGFAVLHPTATTCSSSTQHRNRAPDAGPCARRPAGQRPHRHVQRQASRAQALRAVRRGDAPPDRGPARPRERAAPRGGRLAADNPLPADREPGHRPKSAAWRP